MTKETGVGKVFNLNYNIGRVKYVINMHDGAGTHEDGSPFFGIDTFKNKKKFEAAQKELIKEGYTQECFSTSMDRYFNNKKEVA